MGDPMGGDPKHQHIEKQNGNLDLTKADVPVEHDSTVALTPVDQAHRITKAARQSADPSPGLAAPERVDLGDHVVGGRAQRQDVQIFNTEDLDAYLQISVEGSSSISVEHNPERLRPSRHGNDPITLLFVPTTRGRQHGTLVVHASWQNAIHAPQELRIPIEAAAHEEGEPLIAEQEAEEREQAATAQADAENKAQIEHAKEAAEARLDDPKMANKLPGTASDRKRFEAAENLASDALFDVFENRRVGIDTAQSEAQAFQRHVPPHEESLAERLAWAALDVATAGIASALGKKLEGVLEETMEIKAHTLPSGVRAPAEEHPSSKALVAFFTDSVKDVAQRGGNAATEAIKHHGEGHETSPDQEVDAQPRPELADPGPSADPLLAFFQTEKVGLIGQHRERATEVGQNASNVLEPMLDHSPKEAISAMQKVAARLNEFTKDEIAANTQAQASATHWIRYIAQASLGTVSADNARRDHKHPAADGSPTTNVSSANTAPPERGEPLARDGLIDIRFSADRTRPWEPVTVTSARVHGIGKAMATRYKREPLRDAHVPVRAYADPKGSDPVTGIEVIRDEAGNIEYTDETGGPGAPGNWFASKVGEPRGGRDAEGRGARKLIEEEIVNKQLTVEVESDSDA